MHHRAYAGGRRRRRVLLGRAGGIRLRGLECARHVRQGTAMSGPVLDRVAALECIRQPGGISTARPVPQELTVEPAAAGTILRVSEGGAGRNQDCRVVGAGRPGASGGAYQPRNVPARAAERARGRMQSDRGDRHPAARSPSGLIVARRQPETAARDAQAAGGGSSPPPAASLFGRSFRTPSLLLSCKQDGERR